MSEGILQRPMVGGENSFAKPKPDQKPKTEPISSRLKHAINSVGEKARNILNQIARPKEATVQPQSQTELVTNIQLPAVENPQAVTADTSRAVLASVATGQEMKKVDLIAQEADHYAGLGIEISRDRMLPIEVFTALNEKTGNNFTTQAERDNQIRMVTAFHETAIDYAADSNQTLDPKTLTEIEQAGMQITHLLNSSQVDNFIAHRKGEPAQTTDVTYYSVGACQLEEFFNSRAIPPGESRIPYIIAYAGGVMANGSPRDVAHQVRNWIADTLPTEEPQTEPKPRRLGSFITSRSPDSSVIFESPTGGTTDRGLFNTMRRANSIVKSVFEGISPRLMDIDQVTQINLSSLRPPQFIKETK